MIDNNLLIENAPVPTVAVPGSSWQPSLFPTLLGSSYVDLRAAMDWGRARAVYANFRIRTPFSGPAGSENNKMRLAIFTSRTADMADVLLDPTNPIVRGFEFGVAGLSTVGQWTYLAIPPLGDLARLLGDGRQFIAFGCELLVPTTNWNVGGIDMVWTPQPLPSTPMTFRAGF